VLSSALELLASEGVAGFTTRSIARAAHTSTPAVYELFGDKGGLVRELFFAGFRALRERLGTADGDGEGKGDGREGAPGASAGGSEPRGGSAATAARAELVAMLARYRAFIRENPVLAEVMFSRPFSDFDPSEDERAAGESVRMLVVEHVRRCIEAGVLRGDETDLAHVIVALVQGLALAENAQRLGTSHKSVERRWQLAIDGLLAGLTPAVGGSGCASRAEAAARSRRPRVGAD
jgi:AcrR family transcriptional regulator